MCVRCLHTSLILSIQLAFVRLYHLFHLCSSGMCSDFSLAQFFPFFTHLTHSCLTLTASFIPSAFKSLPPSLLLRNSHAALQSGLNNPSFNTQRSGPPTHTRDRVPEASFSFFFFISYLCPPFFLRFSGVFWTTITRIHKLAMGGK